MVFICQLNFNLESIIEPVSLNEPIYKDSNDTVYVMDQIGDKRTDDNWLNEILIKKAISDLSAREKNTVNALFSWKNSNGSCKRNRNISSSG